MWRAVSMELRIPYFFICHAIEEGGAWLHETCLLWREADVVDFCKEVSQDPDRKIVQLSMLVPSEDIGRWYLQDLKEIWSESDGCSQSPIFIAHDGQQLGRSKQNKSAISVKFRERVYVEPALSTHTRNT